MFVALHIYEQKEKIICKSLNYNFILMYYSLHHIVLAEAKNY